jgi:hypothetical protein
MRLLQLEQSSCFFVICSAHAGISVIIYVTRKEDTHLSICIFLRTAGLETRRSLNLASTQQKVHACVQLCSIATSENHMFAQAPIEMRRAGGRIASTQHMTWLVKRCTIVHACVCVRVLRQSNLCLPSQIHYYIRAQARVHACSQVLPPEFCLHRSRACVYK